MSLKYTYDKETLTALLIGADEEDRTVEIPKTVSYYKKLYDVRIGSYTYEESIDFSNTKIKKIIISDGFTSIGNHAFYGCSSLTSITIPNSVTSIGDGAFDHCRALTSITIPDSVTSIGNNAFNGCTSLTSITIPDSVTTIGNSAFSYCENLREFKGKYVAENGRCIIVGRRLKAYANASGTSFNIPDSVTSIGYGAFKGCSSLTSITIPDSVTLIGYSAFWHCSSLTSITIPNSVTSIEKWAFNDCKSLNVEICNEDGGVNIQPGAFESTAKIKYLGKDAKVTIQTKSEKEETEPKKKGFFARLFGK